MAPHEAETLLTDSFAAQLLKEQNRFSAKGGAEVAQRDVHNTLRPAVLVPGEFAAQLREATDPETPPQAGDWLAHRLWHRVRRFRVVVVVPEAGGAAKEQIIILAHNQDFTHPPVRLTIENVGLVFDWDSLEDDVKTFVSGCWECNMTTDYKLKVSRGVTRLAFGPHSVLGLDFCDMGITSTCGKRWVLVLVDLYALKVRLTATASATAQFAAEQAVRFGEEATEGYLTLSNITAHVNKKADTR